MFLNVEQLKKQLDKEEFQEIGSMAAFNVLETHFQMFIMNWDYLNDEYVAMTRNYFQHWVNERQMQTTKEKVDTSKALDASSIDIESNIRPKYDKEPMVEVQTTAEIDVFAIGQQHTEQPELYNKGEVFQNAKEYHDTCPLPAIFTANQIPEHSYQSLEYENSCLKKTVAQF
nr:hypothetical protein [Tanacetum cinerariifolium]